MRRLGRHDKITWLVGGAADRPFAERRAAMRRTPNHWTPEEDVELKKWQGVYGNR